MPPVIGKDLFDLSHNFSYRKRMLEAKANFLLVCHSNCQNLLTLWFIMIGSGCSSQLKRTKSKTIIFIVKNEFPDSENDCLLRTLDY